MQAGMFQACARCEMNAGEDVVEVGGVAGMWKGRQVISFGSTMSHELFDPEKGHQINLSALKKSSNNLPTISDNSPCNLLIINKIFT